MDKWQCGDCGCIWSSKVTSCPHAFDDYLGVRGVDSVDAAMEKYLKPVLDKFDTVIYIRYSHKPWKILAA